MLGAHLSVAGGLHNALILAQRYGVDCLQVFTKNQRQWNAPPITPPQLALWDEQRKLSSVQCIVSHDTYLINLAAPPGPTRTRSIALMADELLRCDQLNIPYLVTHPGCHMGAASGGDTGGALWGDSAEEAGIQAVAQALDTVHAALPDAKAITCLEVTAGQGSSIGYKLEHLRSIIDAVAQPHRLAVCLDTCHLLAAGYDLTSAAGATRFLKEVDQVIGLDRVKVIHVNDSKTPRGSRVDRHQHIGQGYVDLGALRTILHCRALRDVPKIIETPKDDPPGTDWDAVNLAKLRELAK